MCHCVSLFLWIISTLNEINFSLCNYLTELKAAMFSFNFVMLCFAVKHNHSLTLSMSSIGTCESFFFVRIESRIESAVRFVFESNLRIDRPVQSDTYSKYLVHWYFVFVTNESDVRTTELRTEYLFISIQS